MGSGKNIFLSLSGIFIYILLLFSFIDYLSGENVSCGCFGHIEILDMPATGSIILNLVLVLFLGIIFQFDSYKKLSPNLSKWFFAIIGVIGIVLVTLNAMNRYDGTNETQLSTELMQDKIKGLVLNEEIKGITKDGSEISIKYLMDRSEYTMLFIFSPASCYYCDFYIPAIRNKINIFNKRLKIYGIAYNTDWKELPSFISIYSVDFPIYISDAFNTLDIFNNQHYIFIVDKEKEIIYSDYIREPECLHKEHYNLILEDLLL